MPTVFEASAQLSLLTIYEFWAQTSRKVTCISTSSKYERCRSSIRRATDSIGCGQSPAPHLAASARTSWLICCEVSFCAQWSLVKIESCWARVFGWCASWSHSLVTLCYFIVFNSLREGTQTRHIPSHGSQTCQFIIHLPSGNLLHSYWKWPSRNSGCSHWKWWFSIVFCMFTRGYFCPKWSPGPRHLQQSSLHSSQL